MIIIGIGNEWRGDDAAGLLVADRLLALPLQGVTVLRSGGDGADLLEKWKRQDSVILADAVQQEAPDGTIIRFDLRESVLAAESLPASSHLLGVAEAVELARTLDQLPKSLLLFGIVGTNFGIGDPMSEPVRRGAARAAEMILHEIVSVTTVVRSQGFFL